MATYLGLLLLAAISIVYPAVSAVELPSVWPKGTYGIPMADIGCPITHFSWTTGTRYQDTQDLLGNNYWSDPLHLGGSWSKTYMEQSFCMKTVYEEDSTDPDWESGHYCIFKKGILCPDRFSEGWILWDDQDLFNNNDFSGALPEGVYDDDTKIYFCCREDGDVGTPLALPVDEPFFLLRRNGVCQSVERMTMLDEWFRWDGEDDFIDLTTYSDGFVPDLDSSGNNHKLMYCYYY